VDEEPESAPPSPPPPPRAEQLVEAELIEAELIEAAAHASLHDEARRSGVGSDDEASDDEASDEPALRAPALGDPTTAGLPDPGGRAADGAAAATRSAREALERAGTPRERFAAVAQLAGVPLGCDEFVALLDTVPAGWQRRTVVRRLVRAGGLDDLDAGRVVRRFRGDAERARVATLLVDAGLAHVAAVTDDLGPASADRLRRRRR
jgi:hypothetical protein